MSPTDGAPSNTPAYRAFLSYSHRDKAITRRLHRTLETYRIPAKLVGTQTAVGDTPRRLRPIFRDREELPASGDLGAELSAALRASMFLVVICSPASARSRWVNEEIRQFKLLHGDHRVLAVVVGGEPNASDHPGREDEECFPPALRFRLTADGEVSDIPAEPIAADVRRKGDGYRLAVQKLVAGLTGLKLDELVRRETQRRIAQMTVVATGAVAGMLVTGGLAFYANAARIEADRQRSIADRQRLIAEQESRAARAASDFLVGTFELSNPATENPQTITALTILDRSAERARRELASQPVIQSRLLATLGRAYNNLGLHEQATAAFEAGMPAILKSGPDGAEALLVLATTNVRRGRLDEATKMILARANALLGPDPNSHRLLRASVALTEGRIWTSRSNVPAGVAAFDRALAHYRAVPDAPHMSLATALNNRGLLLSDDGQYAAAKASLSEALALVQAELGPDHLSTGKAWSSLAQNSYNAGDLAAASVQIANALRIQRAVLDDRNPLLADTLSMRGQILHGRGELGESERSLTEAVGIYRRAFGGPHFLIGIAEVYLALIQSERGRTEAALRTLDDAKANYDASYGKVHPNHGDLLVNRAQILARAGRRAEARRDCAAGIAILVETLGKDASFTRSLSGTCRKIEQRGA